ncbi:3-hydroxyacyl-CoA dehydrogenase [Desulfobacterales bacterium HSG16]|nr:3-hydroxyacyl-CoA dehydrogenase [Desulfobacterales bacterium HSG16]
MKIEDIKNILIIGAGTMGTQIGLQCAMSGCDVMIYDAFPKILEKAEKRNDDLAAYLADKELISKETAKKALERIQYSADPEKAGQNADLVSESVPEDPELKGRIFAQFNKICPSRTIFTTNTSYLLPSMFAEATGRPDQFLAFHFHDVALSKIVDVMPHPGTSQEVVDLVKSFAEKIGQIPVVLKKEKSGYIFNSMLSPLIASALNMASHDIASVEDIDRSWMGVMHTPMGPFGIMDSIGLDTVWKVSSILPGNQNNPAALKAADFLKEYVDKNHLGKKTGQGFYSYPEPAFLDSDFVTGKAQ